MSTIQQLVSQLGTGWKLVGEGMPVEETAPVAVPADPANLTPATTVNRGTGRYYVVVQDPEGHQRALFLKADPITTGVGGRSDIVVRQSGVNDSDPSKVYSGDLSKLSWSSGGPVADVPQGAKTPSATSQLSKLDSKGNVIDAQGNITLPDGTKQHAEPKQMRDDATGTTFNLVTDPAGTLHDLGNDVILVKPDGSYTKVATKPKDPSQINVPNIGLVEYDPTKPEGSRYTVAIKAPATNDPKTEVRNGITFQWDPDTKQWLKTDLPANQEIGYTLNDPNSKWIIFYDKQGKEVSRTEKPDWKAPVQVQPGTAPAADLVAAKIPRFDPQTGALEFIDNPNQQKASDATAELARQLGVSVAAGSMSEKQAQDIITGAVNTMNALTNKQQADNAANQNIITAAGNVATNITNAANTGAGLLQQRAATAQNLVQQGLGPLGQTKHGLLVAPPADFGANLVQGAAGFATDLMGGPEVAAAAANLVRRADPTGSMGADAANAYAAMTQLLQGYRRASGGVPHPIEAAVNGNSGMTAGQSLYNPQASTAALNAAGFRDTPEGRAAAMASNPALLQTPQPTPTPLAQPFQAPAQATPYVSAPAQVPGQNYGATTAYTGGVAPWNAVPQASFVSPPPAPGLPPQAKTITITV